MFFLILGAVIACCFVLFASGTAMLIGFIVGAVIMLLAAAFCD